ELQVLGVGAGPPPFHVGDAESVQQPEEAQLILHRKGDALTLSAVPQGGVVQEDWIGAQSAHPAPSLARLAAGAEPLPAEPLENGGGHLLGAEEGLPLPH